MTYVYPAVGPSNGISEIHNANEEPNIAAISGGQLGSTDITVFVICTSLRKPSRKHWTDWTVD